MLGGARWFGDDWGAPVCTECERVPTPFGRCVRCGEPIEAGDSGLVLSLFGVKPIVENPAMSFGHFEEAIYHRLCFLACVAPIVVHLLENYRARCRFTDELPGRWPQSPVMHLWSFKLKQITCEGCKHERNEP